MEEITSIEFDRNSVFYRCVLEAATRHLTLPAVACRPIFG